MSEHRVTIRWRHDGGAFAERQYSRAHTWSFDGGVTVPASAAPTNVPAPYADPANVDPEEAFVAAIASCHMLMFLFLAASDGLEVRGYEDAAVGWMTRNERGVPWVSRVELRPRVEYAGAPPDAEREADLHHRAHDGCYIANSVRTEICVVTTAAEPGPATIRAPNPGVHARATVRASYDRLAAAYAEHVAGELAHKPFDRALLDDLADRVRGAGPVGDVGCGPGHVTAYLRARGVDARGVDLSPEMIDRAP
jgi:organic hydroperoxide reductase OsmC/OhrA